MAENVLRVELANAILDIIHKTHTGLDREDKSILELIEIKPRSSQFAKVPLSCSVSPNDPAAPDQWNDEELASPGQRYNLYAGAKFLESGNGQFFNVRYTVDFTMFFLNMNVQRDEAYILAETIMSRIHHQLMVEAEHRHGRFAELHKKDDYGMGLVNANRAVKRSSLRAGGSKTKTLFKGKMWLQFETYLET